MAKFVADAEMKAANPEETGKTSEPVKPETEADSKPEMKEKVEKMDTEPATNVAEKPAESKPNSASKFDRANLQTHPIELIEIEPVKMSQAVPFNVIQIEPVKPVEIFDFVPEVVEIRAAEPQHVKPVDVDQPIVAEEVKLDKPEIRVPLTAEDKVESVSELTEAELKRTDIGKVAEKLVTKAKIKKIKTKSAVRRKSSASEAMEDATLEEVKENLISNETLSGPKARKRPLEDATSDWTTEGQKALLLKTCLTVLLVAFIVATLAYFIIN